MERPHTYLIAGVNQLVLELCMQSEVSLTTLHQLTEKSRQLQRVVFYDEAPELEDGEFF
ncbi:MAG: hypothetical protein ACLSA6_14825 [Holdemania massiliensis]